MNEQGAIRIAAFVSEGERRAIETAVRQLGEALSQVEGRQRDVGVDFVETPKHPSEAAILLISLLPEVRHFDSPWRQEEARLRALYTPLCESGIPLLFLTVFRHVEASDGENADRIRTRIRRLNLLAIEMSREFAVCVIDLDRALSDVGARRLGTDYRLGGDVADLVAKTIATVIVADALDAVVPFDVQDRVRPIIAARAVSLETAPTPTMGQNLMTLGKGRRRQTVSAVTKTVQSDHVGWLIRQLVRRQIGPGEAINRTVMAVRRRGARDSLALLTSSIGKMIGARR